MILKYSSPKIFSWVAYLSLPTGPGVPLSYIKSLPWKSVPTAFLSNDRAECAQIPSCKVWRKGSVWKACSPLLKGCLWCISGFRFQLNSCDGLFTLLSFGAFSPALITTTSQGGMLSNINYVAHITNFLDTGSVHSPLSEKALERDCGQPVKGDSRDLLRVLVRVLGVRSVMLQFLTSLWYFTSPFPGGKERVTQS